MSVGPRPHLTIARTVLRKRDVRATPLVDFFATMYVRDGGLYATQFGLCISFKIIRLCRIAAIEVVLNDVQ